MDRHYCKQCGKPFNYCRGCTLTPIPHKAAGFCSTECSAIFKTKKIEIPEVVETKPTDKEVQDDVFAIVEVENDGIHEQLLNLIGIWLRGYIPIFLRLKGEDLK